MPVYVQLARASAAAAAATTTALVWYGVWLAALHARLHVNKCCHVLHRSSPHTPRSPPLHPSSRGCCPGAPLAHALMPAMLASPGRRRRHRRVNTGVSVTMWEEATASVTRPAACNQCLGKTHEAQHSAAQRAGV